MAKDLKQIAEELDLLDREVSQKRDEFVPYFTEMVNALSEKGSLSEEEEKLYQLESAGNLKDASDHLQQAYLSIFEIY